MLRLNGMLFALVVATCSTGAAAATAVDDVIPSLDAVHDDALRLLDLAPRAAHDARDLPAAVAARVDSAGFAGDVADAASRAASRVATLTATPLDQLLLLPDGGVLLGYATSEDLQPYRGELVLRRDALAFPAPHPAASPAPAAAQPALFAAAPLAEPAGVAFDPRPSEPAAPHRAASLVAEPTTTRTAALAAGGAVAGILALVGFALYHRIRPNAALENDTRKAIFDAVCANPGLGVHAIAQLAGVSYSTTTYHLERLVNAGMLVMTPDGNKLCYYKNGGAFTESERKILPILKNEEAAKLLEAILDTPGTYRAALAERLGVTATTINWHLRRLREAGLVHETRQGRNAYLFANTDAIRTSIASLAQKLSEKDASVADRLRRYVNATGGPVVGGASS